ncbi:EAL domain-containing protein [Falsibacillus albus]|uniref:EAL domain-containing protein n=1 Tax=Falsibacillus albus TaxID=2478915 RepID=A0A3L7JJI3_9BACI|nr:EAL-associated domain-containing protein [Falsibacillus albus]RLQ90604.1 EAL domain-containing protein [Falsibacillus albus]
MDALEILTNQDKVVPYFQAIFSADEHKVIGYEILGRYETEAKVESLGPFFFDNQIPEEYRIEIDNLVLSKAFDKILKLDQQPLVFVNRDIELLMLDSGEQLIMILQHYEQKGLSLEKVVLEVKEGSYKGETGDLHHLLRYLKTLGIKIALDKMGEESGHLDKISQLSPDILKVDLKPLRNDLNNTTLKDVLYSFSLLARKIGASLLFENIEMDYQLQFAWINGGRYYQGFYLHHPEAAFADTSIFNEKLRVKCEKFIVHEKNKLLKVYELSDQLQDLIFSFFQNPKKLQDPYDHLLEQVSLEFSQMSFRLYICDENGFQLSSNFFRIGENWEIQEGYNGKNWSWRPYFLENIVKMNRDQRGLLSDLYSDIETGENIRTFSYPLRNNHYLFMDLSYEFLYEQEGLLR